MLDMRKDFCVFILSHGRPDNQKTYRTLKTYGYTGDIRIVCDDEDKTVSEYQKKFGAQVYVFNKETYVRRTDSFDNFHKRNSVIFARNACWDICAELGYKYFLVLDDDYTCFCYKWVEDRLRERIIRNLDKVFQILLEYYIASGVKCLAMVQGGDLIGGDVKAFDRFPMKRKVMNSFFCALDRPFQYSGIMNDDVNTYLLLGQYGDVVFSIREALLHQEGTQQNAGGLTDLYLDMGTYTKSFYSVLCSPHSVKIATIGLDHPRIHHKISWNTACPKILDPSWKK